MQSAKQISKLGELLSTTELIILFYLNKRWDVLIGPSFFLFVC